MNERIPSDDITLENENVSIDDNTSSDSDIENEEINLKIKWYLNWLHNFLF